MALADYARYKRDTREIHARYRDTSEILETGFNVALALCANY